MKTEFIVIFFNNFRMAMLMILIKLLLKKLFLVFK